MAETKHDDYFYFVDETKYTTDQATLTGAQIKARIPNLDPTDVLHLEGHGKQPDVVIGDDASVTFQKGAEPKKFYLAPPATFGT